jgi:hypothetical protein
MANANQQNTSNSAAPIRSLITIPTMASFSDVQLVMANALNALQNKILAQMPPTNYGGKRISNVGVPVGADDVVTLRYLTGQQLPPQNTIVAKSGAGFDKATFGLVAALTVTNGLTNYYICENAGTFLNTKVKIKTQAPSGADAHLDIKLSADDGSTFNTIFSSVIVLPNGSTSTVTVTNYALPTIAVGNLLRIDCLQIGSTNPGQGIEVVTKWNTGT